MSAEKATIIEMEIRAVVAAMLNNYMDHNKLDQKGLAKKLKRSQAYTNSLLHCRFNLTISNIAKLAKSIDRRPVLYFEAK